MAFRLSDIPQHPAASRPSISSTEPGMRPIQLPLEVRLRERDDPWALRVERERRIARGDSGPILRTIPTVRIPEITAEDVRAADYDATFPALRGGGWKNLDYYRVYRMCVGDILVKPCYRDDVRADFRWKWDLGLGDELETAMRRWNTYRGDFEHVYALVLLASLSDGPIVLAYGHGLDYPLPF